jgi:hypothetical protein
MSGEVVSEDVAAGHPVAAARLFGYLRSRCSRKLENGLLDLGGPSGGKGHFGTDRVEARLLKDS